MPGAQRAPTREEANRPELAPLAACWPAPGPVSGGAGGGSQSPGFWVERALPTAAFSEGGVQITFKGRKEKKDREGDRARQSWREDKAMTDRENRQETERSRQRSCSLGRPEHRLGGWSLIPDLDRGSERHREPENQEQREERHGEKDRNGEKVERQRRGQEPGPEPERGERMRAGGSLRGSD